MNENIKKPFKIAFSAVISIIMIIGAIALLFNSRSYVAEKKAIIEIRRVEAIKRLNATPTPTPIPPPSPETLPVIIVQPGKTSNPVWTNGKRFSYRFFKDGNVILHMDPSLQLQKVESGIRGSAYTRVSESDMKATYAVSFSRPAKSDTPLEVIITIYYDDY